jgi:hypothetical protein
VSIHFHLLIQELKKKHIHLKTALLFQFFNSGSLPQCIFTWHYMAFDLMFADIWKKMMKRLGIWYIQSILGTFKYDPGGPHISKAFADNFLMLRNFFAPPI